MVLAGCIHLLGFFANKTSFVSASMRTTASPMVDGGEIAAAAAVLPVPAVTAKKAPYADSCKNHSFYNRKHTSLFLLKSSFQNS
nr:hypothetical protein [Veillonella denticariosi]